MNVQWSWSEFADEFLWDAWEIQVDRRNGLWDQLWNRIHEGRFEQWLPRRTWVRLAACIALVVAGIFVVMQIRKDTAVGQWFRRFLHGARQKNAKRMLDGTCAHPIE